MLRIAAEVDESRVNSSGEALRFITRCCDDTEDCRKNEPFVLDPDPVAEADKEAPEEIPSLQIILLSLSQGTMVLLLF